MNKQLKTYEEWNNEGYYVNKGSKAIDFKDNIALFSEEQVSKRQHIKYIECDFEGEPYSNYTPERWSQMAKNSPGLWMDLSSHHRGIPHNNYGACSRVYAYENLGGKSIY